MKIPNEPATPSTDPQRSQASSGAHGSEATWMLFWNVKGWVNGHYEEHDDLATVVAQLQNIADDATLEIQLRRAGRLPSNVPDQR